MQGVVQCYVQEIIGVQGVAQGYQKLVCKNNNHNSSLETPAPAPVALYFQTSQILEYCMSLHSQGLFFLISKMHSSQSVKKNACQT